MIPIQQSIQESLEARGMKRRDFLKFCGAMALTLAMPKAVQAEIAKALQASKRTPVIWLEFQDCAGCSESFLRASRPSTAEVVLETLSVDYHETIMAAPFKKAVISWWLKVRSPLAMMAFIAVSAGAVRKIC